MHRRSQRGPTPPKLLLLVLDWLDVDVGEPPAEGDNAMSPPVRARAAKLYRKFDGGTTRSASSSLPDSEAHVDPEKAVRRLFPCARAACASPPAASPGSMVLRSWRRGLVRLSGTTFFEWRALARSDEGISHRRHRCSLCSCSLPLPMST